MKKKLPKYTFTKLELKILEEVAKGNHSLRLLKKKLSIKPNVLTYHLKKLLRKQIIKSTRKGKGPQKYVYFGNSTHASLLKDLLVTFSHVKWEDILTGLGIEILFEVLDNSGITYKNFSRVTFWRYSRELMALGIVKVDGQGYDVNSRFSILIRFLREYQRFIINNLVRSIAENAEILWRRDLECLIRIPKNIDVPPNGFLKTATSRFNNFGIQILSNYDIYLYSKKKEKIQLEDVILHTLLIEKNNTRYVTYSLLLLKRAWGRVDKEYLLKEAQRLDLGLQINAMFQFLKTKGEQRGLTLPTWNEFMAKAREYEVMS